MKTPNEIRNTPHLLVEHMGQDGGHGFIEFERWRATVIWSCCGGWEHVSVAPLRHSITPSWDDMCRLKKMFFYDDEYAVEYHPPASEYVNTMPNCLHLWRPIDIMLPTPPSWMVGLKKGQTKGEARQIAEAELRQYCAAHAR